MVTQGRSTGVFAARLVFALTSDTHFGQALALSNTCGMCTQPGRGGLSAQTWGCDEQTPLSAAAAPHHAAPWQIHSRTGLLSQHRHGWVFFMISTSLVHICSMFSKRFSVSELRSYYHGLFFFCKNMTPYLLIDVAMNN